MREEKVLLEEVDAIRARLDAYRPYTPDVSEKIRSWFTPRYLYCSTALGQDTPLTGPEIASFLEREIVSGGHPIEKYLSIQRHNKTLDLVGERAKQGASISVDLIREVHRSLTEGSKDAEKHLPGEWKQDPSPPTRRRGHTFRYVDPGRVGGLMKKLLEELDERLKSGHPVKAVTWFYFHFHQIHPFARDNGKVSRLIATCLLTNHGFPPLVIHPDRLGEYLDVLTTVDSTVPADLYEPLSPRFDLRSLLEFFCSCIGRAGERMLDIASGRTMTAKDFSEEVAGSQDRMLSQLLARKTTSWRVGATMEIRALFERVREIMTQFEVKGPLYGISMESAEVVPTHAVSPQLRVGVPGADAGLVGELGLAIRGDPLMRRAINFPEELVLKVGVTSTSFGMQLVLNWSGDKKGPKVHHGPARSAEWPDVTIDEILTETVDRRRQKFEGRLRQQNSASPTSKYQVIMNPEQVSVPPPPQPEEPEPAPAPASASRRNKPNIDGVSPSEPPLSF